MAKETNKKPAKEASELFHNIMKISMSIGLNTPEPKAKKAAKKKEEKKKS